MDTITPMSLVCTCNASWSSILPASPCPFHHPAQTYNGLCTCRGYLSPHPFHADSPMVGGQLWEFDEYQGRHRKG